MKDGTTAMGFFLRLRRKSLKLSLRAMERKAGLSNAFLCQVENGQCTNLTIASLKLIAKGYKTTCSELIELTERTRRGA